MLTADVAVKGAVKVAQHAGTEVLKVGAKQVAKSTAEQLLKDQKKTTKMHALLYLIWFILLMLIIVWKGKYLVKETGNWDQWTITMGLLLAWVVTLIIGFIYIKYSISDLDDTALVMEEMRKHQLSLHVPLMKNNEMLCNMIKGNDAIKKEFKRNNKKTFEDFEKSMKMEILTASGALTLEGSLDILKEESGFDRKTIRKNLLSPGQSKRNTVSRKLNVFSSKPSERQTLQKCSSWNTVKFYLKGKETSKETRDKIKEWASNSSTSTDGNVQTVIDSQGNVSNTRVPMQTTRDGEEKV
jgi:uncharacterized membrane protein (DUF485 family)